MAYDTNIFGLRNPYQPEDTIDFKAIVLRSIDRTRTYSNNVETDSSSNFSLQVSPPLNGNYRVSNLTLPNTIYNITSSNNTIYIYQSSTAYQTTLPAGMYNASNIADAVATALNAIDGVSGTFSASYSTTTGKLSITNTSTAFQLDFSASNVGCADVLGFLRQRSPTSDTTQTSNLICNFNPFQSLFIQIGNCAARYMNPLKNCNAQGSIHVPLVSNSGDIQQIKFSDNPIILSFQNTTSFDVIVRDSAGNVLTLMSEFELEMIKIDPKV